jgi:hypothetical protein
LLGHRSLLASLDQPATVTGCDRDAEKRRQKTRESLRHRERDGVVAPSIVPKGPEKNQRVERKRTYSQ